MSVHSRYNPTRVLHRPPLLVMMVVMVRLGVAVMVRLGVAVMVRLGVAAAAAAAAAAVGMSPGTASAGSANPLLP